MNNLWISFLYLLLSLLICCSTEREKIIKKGERALNAFYSNDLNTFRMSIDSSGAGLLSFLAIEDTLSLKNHYSVSPAELSYDSPDERIAFVLQDQNEIIDTVRITMRTSEGENYLELDEEGLFQLLKHEDSVCNAIGKSLYNRKEKAASFKWFKQGAILNYPESKYYLGILEKDNSNYDEATRLLQEAVDDGYEQAIDALALVHKLLGNNEKALQILEEQAEKGNDIAMHLLGLHYSNVESSKSRDPQSSFYWFKMAVQHGNADAMYSLGRAYERGRHSVSDITAGTPYTPEYDSAIYWFKKAASLGEALSMQRLAKLYLEGIYVDQDFERGWHWLEEASKIDKASAYYQMGEVYHKGIGIPQNKERALEYYKIAEKVGSKVAANRIAQLQKAASN